MERYSFWMKVRYIERPLGIFSVIYIIVYSGVIIWSTLYPGQLKQYTVYLGTGLIFFILSIYFAFTGLLLNDKWGRNR